MAFNQQLNISSKPLRFRGGYVSVSKSTASSVRAVKGNAAGRPAIESGCVTRRLLGDHQVHRSRAQMLAGQPCSARPSGIAMFASSVTENCRCVVSESVRSSRRYACASVRPSVTTACFRKRAELTSLEVTRGCLTNRRSARGRHKVQRAACCVRVHRELSVGHVRARGARLNR